MSRKLEKIPDSDQSARKESEYVEDEIAADAGQIEMRQMSAKTGKHSSVVKQDASRPEFARKSGAQPVAGASGDTRRDRKGQVKPLQGSGRDKATRPREK